MRTQREREDMRGVAIYGRLTKLNLKPTNLNPNIHAVNPTNLNPYGRLTQLAAFKKKKRGKPPIYAKMRETVLVYATNGHYTAQTLSLSLSL